MDVETETVDLSIKVLVDVKTGSLQKVIRNEWRENMPVCKMDWIIAAVVSTLRKGCDTRYLSIKTSQISQTRLSFFCSCPIGIQDTHANSDDI